MSPKPLLSEAWRDIIALGSLVVTVIGFILAYWQIRKTKTAAYAAREAANRSYEETRSQYHRYVLSNASRLLTETRAYAASEHWDKTVLRLRDLAEQISQLAATDDDWPSLMEELRKWEARLSASDSPKVSKKTWADLMTRLQAKIDSRQGPFKNTLR